MHRLAVLNPNPGRRPPPPPPGTQTLAVLPPRALASQFPSHTELAALDWPTMAAARGCKKITDTADQRSLISELTEETLAGFFYRSKGAVSVRPGYQSVSGNRYGRIDTSLSFLPRLFRNALNIFLMDCCNGLLLTRHWGFSDVKTAYVVCNPATEKWVTVPVPATSWSSEVWFVRLAFDPAVSSHFHVFEFAPARVALDARNMKSGGSHTKAVRIYSSEARSWTHPIVWENPVSISSISKGVFFSGMLYLPSADGCVAAVGMDGNYRLIRAPTPHSAEDVHQVYLSQRRLHLVNICFSGLSVWTLEDSIGENWTMKHNITHSQLRGTEYPVLAADYTVISIHPKSNVIFIICGKRYRSPMKLMSYEMDSGKLGFICDIEWSCMTPYLAYVPLFSEALAERSLISELTKEKLAGFFYRSKGRVSVRPGYQSVSGNWYAHIDTSLSFLPRLFRNALNIFMMDCCNGLLLTRHWGFSDVKTAYVVCNPATEKWVTVPVPATSWSSEVWFVRLAFDPAVSSHFHVFEFAPARVAVDAKNMKSGGSHTKAVRIYSSEAGGSWTEPIVWENPVSISSVSKGVFFSGMLYLPSADGCVAAVGMDGNYRLIRAPSPHSAEDVHHVYVSQRQLHLVNICFSGLSVWTLEDSIGENWTMKHNVTHSQLRGIEYPVFAADYTVISIHPKSNVIFIICGKRYRSPMKLMSYEMDSGKLGFICDIEWSCMTPYLAYVPLFSEALADGHYES